MASQMHSILRFLEWPNINQDSLYGRVTGRHYYRIYPIPVQSGGEVFGQSLATTKGITKRKQRPEDSYMRCT